MLILPLRYLNLDCGQRQGKARGLLNLLIFQKLGCRLRWWQWIKLTPVQLLLHQPAAKAELIHHQDAKPNAENPSRDAQPYIEARKACSRQVHRQAD